MSVKKSKPTEKLQRKLSAKPGISLRIFAIGETTYDIQFRHGKPTEGCGGGSSFNSAVSLGRCGLPVYLISSFAKDRIGDLAHQMLLENHVNCNYIHRFEGRSRVALAFFDENQIPEYSFYPASQEALPFYPEPEERDIIILGSSFALRDTGREELLNFLDKSKKKQGIILYDPNARRSFQNDPSSMKKIRENIAMATIVKGSHEDFHFIFGHDKSTESYDSIQKYGAHYLFYTKGAQGVELLTPDLHLELPTREIKVVSTIGAGDNFSAGVVFGIYKKLLANALLSDFQLPDWQYLMVLGNSFAADVCQSSENYISTKLAKLFSTKNP